MTAYDIPVLLVPEDLTSATVPSFARETLTHCQVHPAYLVFDLSAARFISSAGLGHLIHVGRTLDESDGALALAAGSRTVVRLLSSTGLTQVMPHFRTVREASGYLRSLRGQKP